MNGGRCHNQHIIVAGYKGGYPGFMYITKREMLKERKMLCWEMNQRSKSIEPLPSLPSARLTGHQQLVNDVKFSPDTRIIASASFDKSIRLWSGMNGK